MFSIKEIIESKKKIIWTHRDLWPIYGLNHYEEIIENSKYNLIYDFLNNYIYKYKKSIDYKKINIVTISNWHKQIVNEALFYKNNIIKKISNAIDVKVYYPKPMPSINSSFNILFLAHNYLSDTRKGYKLFIDLFNRINESDQFKKFNLKFIVVGDFNHLTNIKNITFLPNIENEKDLNTIYNMSNLYVNTSKYETFGKTTAESMACNTPVIAYKKTGAKDMINHKINGYLVSRYDVQDFYNGLCWLLDEIIMKKNNFDCSEKILQEFSIDKIYKEYELLYEENDNS